MKPNGHLLFLDYATGDLAQERFTSNDQKISENFYVRGDGTRAFCFSNDFLMLLFKENGFDVVQLENRLCEMVMNRPWVQAVFKVSNSSSSSFTKDPYGRESVLVKETVEPKVNGNASKEPDYEVDMSEGMAMQMFGLSALNNNEVIEMKFRDQSFKINVLSKEYQHTCKSTGLMLWETACMMASVLAGNQAMGKEVLELGCLCGGLCSMVAVRSADLVVAMDGDLKALELLSKNVSSNLRPPRFDKLVTVLLEWGNHEHIEAIKKLSPDGYDIIIGTDVTYVPEAILPLFATAKELISSKTNDDEDQDHALILCHIFRRVDEPSLLSAASQYGFGLVDK